MRCTNCGQSLKRGVTICTCCGADISAKAYAHRLTISLVYALLCIAAMAAVLYCALLFVDVRP